MKIKKHINYNLEFEDGTLCDVYLATSLYKYILEKNRNLEDYIGYSSEDNSKGIHDFLYACSGNETKIIHEIEEHINKFLKDFELVEGILESKCDEDLITDDVEFYEQFKKLSKVLKEKQQLDLELKENNTNNKKLKI